MNNFNPSALDLLEADISPATEALCTSFIEGAMYSTTALRAFAEHLENVFKEPEQAALIYSILRDFAKLEAASL